MKAEEIRKIIDEVRERQKNNTGKFESGPKFWNAFFAQLFIILFNKFGK